MNDFIVGFCYLTDGFGIIFKPGMKRFVFIPLIINTLLFVGLFFFMRHTMSEFNNWFEHHVPAWLHWISLLLWLLFFLSFSLVFIYTFITFANIISAPFNSFLAEKVEWYLTGKTPESAGLLQNIKDVPRMIGRQLAIVGYYLPRATLILILFFIPILQLGAAVIWFLFNAWFMVLTYIDYPTDNHRVPLKTVRSWLKQKRYTALGLGVAILICSMIPLLNFFTLPAAVAAATKFWVEN